MVLGPRWNPAHDSPPRPESELLPRVRTAAEELVDRLERAAGLSGDFADRPLAQALVDAAMSDCLAQLAELDCWGRANQLASGELWRIAGRWLSCGWLQTRAKTKPRGYAGDFELVERLWERRCTDDPRGAVFDDFFQRQAAVEAVRCRIAESAAALVAHCYDRSRRPYRAVTLASGAAIELAEALGALPAGLRQWFSLVLLDFDHEALEHARARLAPLVAPEQLELRRENLFRVRAFQRQLDLLEQADFVLCLGLFDYLEDEPAAVILKLIWERLAEGGLMLVGNFAPHCTSRAYMEWIGNWYLLYRTADELARLAELAGIPAACVRITAELTGNDLFLQARR
jgi:SAM-dependent methyltransferase